MNDAEFKRHLKDLVHGHHHPEEHDWETRPETEHRQRNRAEKARPAKLPKRSEI